MLTCSNPSPAATVSPQEEIDEWEYPECIDVRAHPLSDEGIAKLKAAAILAGFSCTDPQAERNIWAAGHTLKFSLRASLGQVEICRVQGSTPENDPSAAPGGATPKPGIVSPSAAGMFTDRKTIAGTTPIMVIHHLWSRLQARFSADLPGDLPLLFFAARFDASKRRNDSEWSQWPDGLLWVPEVIYVEDRTTGEDTCFSVVVDGRTSGAWANVPSENPSNGGKRLPNDWLDDESREGWCDRVRDTVDAVRGGELDKAVLARSRRATAPHGHRFDAVQTVANLHHLNPELAVFSLAEGEGVFLGATPERLVRIDQGAMHSHALAGTAASESEVLNDDKLRIEHRCVVEQMLIDLDGLLNDIHVGDTPKARRAGRLVHLETELGGVLGKDGSLLKLVDALHPTPALGGVPRVLSLDWLRTKEPLDRGFYGGPLGWLCPNGDGVCLVAIRSALLYPTEAIAYAGAGIVAASDPEAEWGETEQKFDAIGSHLLLRPLGDAS